MRITNECLHIPWVRTKVLQRHETNVGLLRNRLYDKEAVIRNTYSKETPLRSDLKHVMLVSHP